MLTHYKALAKGTNIVYKSELGSTCTYMFGPAGEQSSASVRDSTLYLDGYCFSQATSIVSVCQ